MKGAMKRFFLFALLVLHLGDALAAIDLSGVAVGDPVRWKTSMERRDTTTVIVFKATID